MNRLTEVPSDFQGFMASRRVELEQRYADLAAQMEPIRAELRQIEAAERALSGQALRVTRTTLQQMALEVISGAADGLTTQQAAGEIGTRFGREVSRESLAPQLSRLQGKGAIVNTGGVHRIAARALTATGGTNDDPA